MKNYKELIVWQKSMELVVELYEVSKKLPKDEKFRLIDQISRAAISIPSNIAEGSGRNSQKELRHFLGIALGSAFELEALLLIIMKLALVQSSKINSALSLLIEVQKMLSVFIRKL